MRKAKLMSRINFEGDAVANVEQTGLESVAELLREQLKLEELIESMEETIKINKEALRNLSIRDYITNLQFIHSKIEGSYW